MKYAYRFAAQIGILFLLAPPAVWSQAGQLAVPRVELMPNLPSPYNVRDWRTVALGYDSLVYDETQTGQYLPVVAVQSNGVNYPQSPAFGLHTYLGTFSPAGNEAINVLPSLVGASLCGIDKSNQFGRDWIAMSRDFFSKNSGEDLYLNNKGGGSGSDWWYDIMPNVYFYQICALYPPAPGSIADQQFTRVADRLTASVRVLGGSDTPWQKGNFDYRAFNFNTMQPNPNGVHEPEAAGAYAWVLYHAYRRTGQADYLKAAEWSLEFLDDWTVNPSYELQLPYGTYTAARMNAEIGTEYDVEKMLNWSFNKGPLRGWGTIVGNWGGFDVSGVVGEANDAGNDYAFQLNGVQQAAALAPMVRYDKRFARAIGKWILNLANATRLFYPGFLPSSYQDASTWSNANDPDRVMGYEALREQWQGISPFSTGDALGGGWAATNLSLYSTGSIGYLGAIVEKTNVDKILKINVLATDFYHDAAYPTYLFFNPYNNTQTIAFDAGAAPADLYDALTETFLLQNVTGLVNLSIPANQAVLVSICPAGGAISYDRNKMLVGGVVVDYSQHQQAWVKGPRIQALAAANPTLEIGQSTALFAQVQAGDNTDLDYAWAVTDGTLSATGNGGQWTTPGAPGTATLTLIVTDGNSLTDTAVIALTTVEEINKAPEILAILKGAGYTAPGGTLVLEALATDANGDPLDFTWSASAGSISGTGNTVQWTAPNSEGICEISLSVADDEGLSDEAGTKILVNAFAPTSGNMIAYYNFSDNANDLTANQLHGIPFATVYAPDVDGSPASAISFNGVNSRVTVPVQPVLNFQDGITVSCWFKATELPAKELFLLSHGSWQERWKISITPDKRVRWTVNTLSAIGDLDSDFTPQIDSFYHIAAIYDGELLTLYLNGQLNAFGALSGKIRTSTSPFLMGQMLPGITQYNFKGVLDEVKIFDYALTPAAVDSLYQSATTAVHNPAVKGAGLPLSVSPNPAAGHIRVSWSDAANGAGNPVRLAIHDAQGRMMLEENRLTGTSIEFNIKNWKTGFYVVSLYRAEGISKAVFIKE